MARDNFWENVEAAQEVLKRRAQLQAPADRWQKLWGQVEEAVSLLDLAAEADDAEVLQEVQVGVAPTGVGQLPRLIQPDVDPPALEQRHQLGEEVAHQRQRLGVAADLRPTCIGRELALARDSRVL